MSEVEEWREIPGYPGYDVSSMGRVRGWRGNGPAWKTRQAEPRVLTPETSSRRGYPRVCIRPGNGGRRKTMFVHTLVLMTFVGPRPPGMMCRHFPDRTPANVRLDNLSWCSSKQNHDDMITHETRAFGTSHWTHTKPWCLATGDRHFSRTKPERLARGERSGAFRHPEKVPRGESNGTSKLTDDAVRRILLSSESCVGLGNQFGVTDVSILNVKNGVTWRHVTVIGPIHRAFAPRAKYVRRCV